jgi:hypothetical protein
MPATSSGVKALGFELDDVAVEHCAAAPPSGPGQPDQLPAAGTGVYEPEILDERHEAPLTWAFTGRANRGGFRIHRGDPQETAVRVRHHRGSAGMTGELVFSVGERFEAKNAVVELGGHCILS